MTATTTTTTTAANLRTNYHTHSNYCDGIGEIADYLAAAVAAGLDSYGVSSHAPVPIVGGDDWMMPLGKLPQYVAEVRRLRGEYAGRLPVYMGLELDYAPGLADWYTREILPHRFDYFVGSVHYAGVDGADVPWCIDESAARFADGLATGYDGDIRRALETYFALQREMAAARIPGIAIVGHMDKAKMWNFDDTYFHETDAWYVSAIEETLRVFKAAGLIVELNTAGMRRQIAAPYPSSWVLARCHALGVPVCVNTDAHKPDEITAGFPEAEAILRDVGITEVMVRVGEQWEPRAVV